MCAMCKKWSKQDQSHSSTKYLSNGLHVDEIPPTENKQLVTSGRLGHKWWGCSSSSMYVLQSQASKTKYWSSFNMMTLVWLLAIAGLLVALIVYEFFSRQHYQQYKDMLAYMCDERARMLQYQFSVSMNHVHALSILVSMFYLGKHSTMLDQNIFAEYTAKTAFERPLMTGVAYAHRVLHFEREEFEKAQGWTIKTMHLKEPSPVYDEYAPIIFSQETIGYIVSLDMMSGEEDRENILRARETGKGVLTSPFRLLKSNHLGVVLTFAVYNKELPLDATVEERIEAAVGYLGGPFDVESLVDILLVQLAKSEDIIVNVYDVTNVSNPLIMYGAETTGYGFSHISSLDFGDPYRKHQMYCSLARKIPRSTLAVGFAAGVLVFVTLICAMVYNAHKHVKKVEKDYRKMEELKVQAEAADIAKSQFLATVSHEIRTPMNGVLGMLQMLLDTQLNATQQDFARTAQASGKALINLINEVLDQAKIESGRIELEAVPFDLRAILDDVLSLFSGKTRDEGVELAIYVSERIPRILIGDPSRIRQVITNLVGNSVKFTEKGHIFVCVHRFEDIESVKMANAEAMTKFTAECQLAKNHNTISSSSLSGQITASNESSWDFFKLLIAKEKQKASESELSEIRFFISVEDTGIGIPSHAQDRIFTPFMQADSSMSRTYGGTGIGLSISRCLVDLMKGEMWFVSKENVGSTFSFSCELRKGDEQVGEDKSFLNDRVLVNKFKGIKILVLDGRQVRLEVARNHLQRLGLQVFCVSEFELAVKILSGAASTGVTSFTQIDMALVDKDAWGPSSGLKFPLSVFASNQDTMENNRPKMILMANSMTSTECETAKCMGYIDTIIMKPLRATMIAACLQEVLGMGNRNQQEIEKLGNLRKLLYGKQILVVDDNKVNRIVAAGALKKYGAHVECADSGKVAIAMLKPPHRFDACFMDIQMPEMDGFEATRHIRLAETLANSEDKSKTVEGPIKVWHVPILAMTADVIQATYDECIRCKMDGYVSKPFEEEQLYIAVHRVLTMPAS